MNTDQFVQSFIGMLQCVTPDEALVSADDPIESFLNETVDALDFELAATSFEVTHRVTFNYDRLQNEEVELLTIRQMIKNYLVTDSEELSDPLFIAKRIAMFKDSVIEAVEAE